MMASIIRSKIEVLVLIFFSLYLASFNTGWAQSIPQYTIKVNADTNEVNIDWQIDLPQGYDTFEVFLVLPAEGIEKVSSMSSEISNLRSVEHPFYFEKAHYSFGGDVWQPMQDKILLEKAKYTTLHKVYGKLVLSSRHITYLTAQCNLLDLIPKIILRPISKGYRNCAEMYKEVNADWHLNCTFSRGINHYTNAFYQKSVSSQSIELSFMDMKQPLLLLTSDILKQDTYTLTTTQKLTTIDVFYPHIKNAYQLLKLKKEIDDILDFLEQSTSIPLCQRYCFFIDVNDELKYADHVFAYSKIKVNPSFVRTLSTDICGDLIHDDVKAQGWISPLIIRGISMFLSSNYLYSKNIGFPLNINHPCLCSSNLRTLNRIWAFDECNSWSYSPSESETFTCLLMQYLTYIAQHNHDKEFLLKILEIAKQETNDFFSNIKFLKLSEDIKTNEEIHSTYHLQNKTSDYAIHNCYIHGDSLKCILSNEGEIALPVSIVYYGANGGRYTSCSAGWLGVDTLSYALEGFKHIHKVIIDEYHLLPESNIKNNMWTDDNTLSKMLNKFSVINRSKRNQNLDKLLFAPLIGYNQNDKTMAGFVLANTITSPSRVKWAIAPLYSFNTNSVVGQAKLGYDLYFSQNNDRLNLQFNTKSFHKFTQKEWEYSERFILVNPSISYHINNIDPERHHVYIRYNLNLIYNEEAIFRNGNFDGLVYNRHIWHNLEASKSSASKQFESKYYAQMEWHRFNFAEQTKSYLRLTAELNYSWGYKKNKYMSLRIFGGGFLINDQRNSLSFNNVFAPGSLSLTYQGINDYLYEGYFLSRQNTSNFFDGQISENKFGGFKVPLGPAFSYGMTNHLMFTANYYVDLPIPQWTKRYLGAYFDFGSFAVPNNEESFDNLFAFNAGFCLRIKDYVKMYIPLIYNQDLKNTFYQDHNSFFSRLSFTLNFNSFDGWNKSYTVGNYLFK